MSRDEEPGRDQEDEVTRQLRADAARTGGVPDDLWGRIEADLSRGSTRDTVVSWSTPVRMGLGLLGVLVMAGTLVAVQGIRPDLDSVGWLRFGGLALPVTVTGIAMSGFSLVHRGQQRPIPGLAIAVAWAVGVASSLYAGWPGLPRVPAAMDVWCFLMTSLGTLAALAWLTSLERGRTPVVWRVGAAAAGGGLAAFVAQGVFCPGADPVHLLVAHAGAAIVWASLGMRFALGWGLRRAARVVRKGGVGPRDR